MIKRDSIQRCRLNLVEDGMGGGSTDIELFETVRAHVSVSATVAQITQYGVQKKEMLNVATNIKLDEYVNTRYLYNGKMFRLIRQVKSGAEWFSVFEEVNEGVS